MSDLLVHKFEIGDRVKATTTQGWLKMDSIGLVTAVFDRGSDHEDAYFRDDDETIMVAWPKSAYVDGASDDGFDPWDGKIYGVGQINIHDFEKPSYELPMHPRELTFIDNLRPF